MWYVLLMIEFSLKVLCAPATYDRRRFHLGRTRVGPGCLPRPRVVLFAGSVIKFYTGHNLLKRVQGDTSGSCSSQLPVDIRTKVVF